MREQYLNEYLSKYQYDEKPAQALHETYRAAGDDPRFENELKAYETDTLTDYKGLFARISGAAEDRGLPVHTLHYLFFVLAAEHLEKLYRDRGWPQEMLDGVAADLKIKLGECYKMTGVWGTLVGSWHVTFYQLGNFALGRLQFQPGKLTYVDLPEYGLTKEDNVLYVHIPGAGKLLREDCDRSFARAYEFFKDRRREDGSLVFVCHSWLLDPDLADILPEGSNIPAFARYFRLLHKDPGDRFYDAWRVYYRDADKPAAEWPENTTLQRAIKKHLLAGGMITHGFGMRIYGKEDL